MIPEAQQACMAARANTLVPKDSKRKWNPSMDNLDAYLIAEQVAPKQLNLMNNKKNVSMQQIHQEWVSMIQNYLVDDPSKTTTTNKTPNIPKHCLPKEELERLLQKLFQIERDVLSPPWYHYHPPPLYPPRSPQSTKNVSPPLKEWNNEHRSAFANYVAQEKYCSVDFEQLWNNKERRTVLQQAVQPTTTITTNQ
jgi:hypothetical protein